jgi:hypothetical protein
MSNVNWSEMTSQGETTLTDATQYATVRLSDGTEIVVTATGRVFHCTDNRTAAYSETELFAPTL